MAILYYLIISVHIIACFFLIGVVLLQQGKGQDLASAFGGGGSQTAFGPRGSATVPQCTPGARLRVRSQGAGLAAPRATQSAPHPRPLMYRNSTNWGAMAT